MRIIIPVSAFFAGLVALAPVAAQPSPAFVPSEPHVRDALAFKMADASSARIGPLAAFEAPEGSTWDYFVCGKVHPKDATGGYGGEQDVAVGVKANLAEPVYSALGVGDMATHFCEMVAEP